MARTPATHPSGERFEWDDEVVGLGRRVRSNGSDTWIVQWRVDGRTVRRTLGRADLRHNFASHTLLAGESLLIAGSLLGHSRPAMTARYAHLSDDHFLHEPQRIATAIATMDSCKKLSSIEKPLVR